MKEYDCIVVGNVGIDTNVYFHDEKINFDVETNFTTNKDYIGQAGGYASRGFAQLGYKTAFIGHVGADFSGRYIRETFKTDGIDISGMFTDPAGTARSINFMYSDGRRKNFYDAKGHMTLAPNFKKCQKLLSHAKLVHFNIPNWARKLLPIARKCGVTISIDLQDIVSIDDDYRKDFIRYSDVLFFSAVNFESPDRFIHEVWRKYPEKILIAGMGKSGCALGKNEKIQYYPAIEFDEPVLDTNGAGDGLAVGFLSQYFIENKPLQQAITAAQIVARHTCNQKASTDHLITTDQLQEKLTSTMSGNR